MSISRRKASFGRLAGRGLPAGIVDSRTLLQSRVALYVQVQLVLTAVTFVAHLTLVLIRSADSGGWVGSDTPSILGHLSFVALLGLVWLFSRQGRRGARLLHAIEGTGTALICTAYAAVMLTPTARASDPTIPETQSMVLLILLTLTTRAALVPSSAGRSLVVGLLSIGPVIVTSRISQESGVDGMNADLVLVVGLAFVVVTAVTSRVIYGLQARVREVAELGQYRLEREIGHGGMGTVYLARHALLRRPTAIKLLPPEQAAEGGLRRFEQEVQHTSQLTHPNTVEIYDFGHTPDGSFYYAMEYLDGVNLGELVELDGPQPAGRVIRILTQVAGALSEAHDRGLIHRDIKPANIILVDRGGILDTAKIVDFGLVKEIDGADEVALTARGTIVGTPLFMSPEMASGRDDLDGRTDLYSLGAVGYYLLTGRFVFEGANAMQVIAKHLSQPPPPMAERFDRPVPSDLEAVIQRCLQKERDRRPDDARELEAALLACRDAGTWTQRDARRWWDAHRDLLQRHSEGRTSKATGPSDEVAALLPTLPRVE